MSNLRRWDASATAGEVLGLLTRDGRHQELLDAALERLGGYLGTEEVRERASNLLVKFARKEWPRIIAAVDVIASVDGIADNLPTGWRARWCRSCAKCCRSRIIRCARTTRAGCRTISDGCAAIRRWRRAEALKQRAINHPKVQEYVRGLWDDIHAALRRDLSTPDSALAAHLESALLAMGRRLAEDAALREALNRHVLGAARRLTGRLRAGVTGHIARTVKNWDERHLVDELELSVGRDLQYIRFNGTLVGGLIGWACTRWCCWRAAERWPRCRQAGMPVLCHAIAAMPPVALAQCQPVVGRHRRQRRLRESVSNHRLTDRPTECPPA